MDTAFAFVTAILLVYALFVFVGPRAAMEDLARPVKRTRTANDPAEPVPEQTEQAA